MSRPGSTSGTSVGPFDGCLDAELIRRYAVATRDPSPSVRSGELVPPVAIVTQIWEAENAARAALVPAEVQRTATGGVHGQHDVLLHRPILPGEPLRTWVHAHGTRPAGRHAAVTLRYATEGAGGERVAEQWWTTVYLGTRCAETGAAAPRHAFPEEARARPLGAHAVEVDGGMARRYAEVSGDWSPHHFDPEAARRSGADRPFLHGLCTMALCAQAVTHLAGGDDPDRIGRIAVRFAAPVPLGSSLVVAVFDAGPGAVAFEAAVGGTPVVTNGWVELR